MISSEAPGVNPPPEMKNVTFCPATRLCGAIVSGFTGGRIDGWAGSCGLLTEGGGGGVVPLEVAGVAGGSVAPLEFDCWVPPGGWTGASSSGEGANGTGGGEGGKQVGESPGKQVSHAAVGRRVPWLPG